MVNPQLLDYINKELARGVIRADIEKNAASGGWSAADITEAFNSLNSAIKPTQVQSGAAKYAGFWIRFVAVMVDGAILMVPSIIIQFLVKASLTSSYVRDGVLSSESVQFITSFSFTLVSWGYAVFMIHFHDATLGKMLVGIAVRSEKKEKLSIGKIILRETVGKLLSGITLGIGYIMAGFTSNKQSLHDKIAQSVVVYKDPSKPHTAGLIVGIIIASIIPLFIILGVLSSIVLVGLAGARDKASDAGIKSNLSQLRVYAEVYYANNGGSYSVAKSCDSGMFADSQIKLILSNLKNMPKVSSVECYAEGQTWAAVASKGSSSISPSYCIDNTGALVEGNVKDALTKPLCEINRMKIEKISQ